MKDLDLMTDPKVHWPIEIPVLAICLVAGLCVRLIFLSWPIEWLDARFVSDDAYIGLNIARNIASGVGEYGDSLHSSNGYQPLFVWLMTPFFWIFPEDRDVPVRIAQMMGAVFSLCAGWILYRIIRLRTGPLIALCGLSLWLFSCKGVTHGMNAQETSLSLFLLLATVYYLLTFLPTHLNASSCLSLGVLSGLSILARVDNALLAGIILANLMYESWRRHDPWKLAMAFIGGLFICLGPWLFVTLALHGTFIPESGVATRFQSMIQENGTLLPLGEWVLGNAKAARSTLEHLIPTSEIFSMCHMYSVLWFILGGLTLFAGKGLLKDRKECLRTLRTYWVLSVFLCCLVMFYIFVVGGTWFFPRYFYPVSAFYCILFCILLHMAVRGFYLSATRRNSLGVFILLVLTGLNIPGLMAVQYTSSQGGGYREIGQWLNSLSRPNVVGSFQSGAMAYYNRKASLVVNLDGKVNSYARKALKEKRMYEYLKEQGVELVVDWPVINVPRLLHHRSRNVEVYDRVVLQKILPIQSWGRDWAVYEVK